MLDSWVIVDLQGLIASPSCRCSWSWRSEGWFLRLLEVCDGWGLFLSHFLNATMSLRFHGDVHTVMPALIFHQHLDVILRTLPVGLIFTCLFHFHSPILGLALPLSARLCLLNRYTCQEGSAIVRLLRSRVRSWSWTFNWCCCFAWFAEAMVGGEHFVFLTWLFSWFSLHVMTNDFRFVHCTGWHRHCWLISCVGDVGMLDSYIEISRKSLFTCRHLIVQLIKLMHLHLPRHLQVFRLQLLQLYLWIRTAKSSRLHRMAVEIFQHRFRFQGVLFVLLQHFISIKHRLLRQIRQQNTLRINHVLIILGSFLSEYTFYLQLCALYFLPYLPVLFVYHLVRLVHNSYFSILAVVDACEQLFSTHI